MSEPEEVAGTGPEGEPDHDAMLELFAAEGVEDMAEWLAKGGEEVGFVARRVGGSTVVRPRIFLTAGRNPGNVRRDIHAAILMLNAEKPTLFTHQGRLVEYQGGSDDPEIFEVDAIRLSKYCTMHMDFIRPRKPSSAGGLEEDEETEEAIKEAGSSAGISKDTYLDPPMQRLREYCVDEVAWRDLPELVGIVRLPIVRPDGTFVAESGWDPVTGYYYEPLAELRSGLSRAVPEEPTRAQIDWAVSILRDEILGDFEFLTNADRANAIGALLSPMLRFVYKCPQPIHMCTAHTPGTGKSLLAGTIGAVSGSWQSVTYDTDSEEMRKKITSTLITGSDRVVIFDNVPEGTSVDSPVLAKLSTDPIWSDRKLGESRTVKIPNDRMWVITGNNLATGGDMGRRVVWVVQDSGEAHPEDRPSTTFKYPGPELRRMIKRERGTVVLAMLTLVQAWKAAGGLAYEPGPDIPRMGGFEPWVRVVGGVLEVAGVSDFLGNVETRREENDEGMSEGEGLLHLMETYFGKGVEFTPGDAAARLLQLADDNAMARLTGDPLVEMVLPGPVAVRCVAGGSLMRVQTALGRWFKAHEKRPFGTDALILERRVDSHTKSSHYKVTRLAPKTEV